MDQSGFGELCCHLGLDGDQRIDGVRVGCEGREDGIVDIVFGIEVGRESGSIIDLVGGRNQDLLRSITKRTGDLLRAGQQQEGELGR